MSVTSRIALRFDILQNKAADMGTGEQPYAAGINEILWRSGVGYNEADLVFGDTRSLGTGANEDLDFVGGFNDAFGTAVSPAKIKAVIIVNNNTDTQTLTLKSAAANGWAGMLTGNGAGVTVQPGSSQCPGMFCWIAPKGVAITAATADLINVLNSAGATVSYSLIVVGTSS